MPDVIAEAAAREGVHPRTIRRRLLAVDHAVGGGLVRSFQRSGVPRLLWVNLDGLKAALERPEARTAEIDWMASQIENLQQSVAALKKAHRQLKKHVFTHCVTPANDLAV